MKPILGIARVSTARQFNQGNSVEAQVEQIRAFSLKLGRQLLEVVKIQASGKTMVLNHGQLSRTITRAREMEADLVVTKLDRLSRDQISLLQLKKASQDSGVQIHVSSMDRTINEISSLEFTLLASFAQIEREQIQARIKEACKNRVGPIGQTLNAKELQRKSLEKRRRLAGEWAESVKLKQQIIEAGQNLVRPNLKNVARWLNGNGSLSRRGKPWALTSLQQQVARLGWSWRELVGART